MESNPLFVIDGEAISLEQALQYLRIAGELPKTLREITQQHVLEKEIQMLGIEEPSTDIIEQLILEFRLQKQLTTPDIFQLWLASQRLAYSDFRHSIIFRLQLESLKSKVTEPKIQNYFEENKALLDRIVLSRIVVETAETAQGLKEKIEQHDADFTQLAKQFSIVDDSVVGGVMGSVMRGQMPKPIYEATESAQQGQIIGPLEIEGRYCLLKIEQLLPVKLEGELKQELENRLFNEWLREKIREIKIQFINL
ncbi:hypothetical protein A6769_35110 [Nostoc punctiforme NIES-2108]|uniref:peptidylprolyl isomerase n=1 Tax=Nostoc punctiforme NIES-2108 TaxID=1356359 RepID=A0A367R1S0_NOSPU|nr:hypothetical protein A6769_35110 [Nostoc punctiforme NIES-2108]